MVIKEDSDRIKELKHKSRRYSIQEGIFNAAKISFGDYYVSPFAIAINASSSLVALFSSIPGLLGPLSQVFSSRLIEKTSRKKIILRSVLLESLLWIPFVLVAFLFYYGIAVKFLPIFLLLVFSLNIIIMNITSPAWFSWMGDIIDEEYRGRWFAKRNLLIGFVSVLLAISSAFALDYLEKRGFVIFGFAVLFSLTIFMRLLCYFVFKKQYEPKLKLKKGYYFSFYDFIMSSSKSNFGKFTIFRSFLWFAASISSPLFSVYLLRTLELTYPKYMILILIGTFYSLLVLKLFGKLADNYGNYRILCISSVFIPLVPILWILSSSFWYLVTIPPLVSGISWAGFNLASSNFIYDNVSVQKRGLIVSYFNLLGGLGVFLGGGLGALLIKFLSFDFIEPIIAIFIFGGIVRMVVVFFGLGKIKEIKKTKKIKSFFELENTIFREMKPTLIEEFHDLKAIKSYIWQK